MDNSIITALIAGGVTLTVSLLTNWTARKKQAVEQAKRDQKLDDSITELSKRVDAHNQLGDKIANIEKAIVRIDTKLESIK